MNATKPLTEKTELFVGLMSGTSMDGIDAVLVDFSNQASKLVAAHYLPYSRDLAERLLALQQKGEDELHRASILGLHLAHLYHQASEEVLRLAAIPRNAIRAIGCHGQTVRHNPKSGYTTQLGNPALLAELSGIDVVTDFRSRDIAAGGQGAPLVPAFHEAVFRSSQTHRLVLNVGGFANVTDLDPDSTTRGFDTGPGNVLMDAWAQKHIGQAYDDRGAWADRGRVLPEVLDGLLANSFFSLSPPKSCGRELFDLAWVESIVPEDKAPEDVQATLCELTARSIAAAVERWCNKPSEVAVCGGGAHNLSLLKRLKSNLPNTRIVTTEALGIHPDWVEAMAFAWLARQAVHGLPGNLPAVTGSRGPRILGAIYQR